MSKVNDGKAVNTHELSSGILDLFEDMLEEKGITVPDEDREGDTGEARLYGMTYADLQDKVENILNLAFQDAGVPVISGTFSEQWEVYGTNIGAGPSEEITIRIFPTKTEAREFCEENGYRYSDGSGKGWYMNYRLS